MGRAHYALSDLGETERELREAERELREARRLAESAQSPLIAAVLRAEAIYERRTGNWDEVDKKLRQSLAVAREHDYTLLEADDLSDIGFDSLHSEHYDQALQLSQEAARFATSVQARRPLQNALGNIGWAYLNLGDFENALVNFQAAEQQAHELAMTSARVVWLQDAGLAEYELGNFGKPASMTSRRSSWH